MNDPVEKILEKLIFYFSGIEQKQPLKKKKIQTRKEIKFYFYHFSTPGTANYTPTAQSGYVATPNYGTTTQRATTGYDQSQYASQTYASKYNTNLV